MDKVRAHVLISGLVQGIFFRSRARHEAQVSGVTGWVMNRMDGRVEAVFEGEKSKVDRLIEWCHEGPPGAVVRDVDVTWEDYRGEFDSFFVKYRE